MYITPDRQHHLERHPAVTPGDLAYLLYVAATEIPLPERKRVRPPPAQGYDAYFKRFDQVIEGYLPAQPKFENFAIILGSFEIVRRELFRRYTQQSLENRKAIELYAENYFYETVVPYFHERQRVNGDLMPCVSLD